MKSLITLLDRKKKDRANTLVQVPFPSTLPQAAVHQDGQVPTHGVRRTSTPSSFLRPQQQHRAASDNGRMHRPLLSEPSPYYRETSPAQNASYYTDSDDGTFVDPFAPSSTKLDLASKPHHDATPQVYLRRGSESSSTNTHAPSSFRFRLPQEPTGVPPMGQPQPQSGATAPTSKKGRWLRERRSLTSLLRLQQPNNPAESVPTVPPVPNRVLERKSSFFTRGRSGSTPPATQMTERTHTARQPSTGLESVQLPTSASPQPKIVEMKTKDKSLYRGSTPLALASVNLPNSAMRAGEGRDSGLPTSPNTRRRAVSVPLPLPQPTEPPPPLPGAQHSQHTRKPEADRSAVLPPELGIMRRPGTSVESRPRPGHNAHGTRSASVSVPAQAKPNTIAYPNRQEQLASQHHKQSSVSAAEGLVLKSALKHRPVESIQKHSALATQSIKPLRICKRECTSSKTDSSQLPTPSSESSLNGFHHACVDYTNGTRASAQHHKTNSGSSSGRERLENSSEAPVKRDVSAAEGPVTSSGTTGSFGNLMRGHDLSSNDSRSLPVLDNIWGSFISETAFGNSLPPSPVASISTRYRATQSQAANGREQTRHSSTRPEGVTGAYHSPPSGCHWKPGSAPPYSPPVADLPPVPKPPPALTLSLSSGPRRRRSRSSANAAVLLTPPTSPTEEIGHQSLDRVISTSISGNSPNSSGNKYSTSHRQLGPRLARSASSPSIRPPVSPEIGHYPINLHSTDAVSRLSVQHQNSRSIPPSSESEFYSQSTPVPGTPVTVLPLAIALTSYPGASSGSPVASSPHMWVPREGSGYAESTESSVIGVGTQVHGNGSGVSETITDRFPPVQSNQVLAQERKMMGTKSRDAKEEDPYEEPLLTPPVTPAWVAHVFDPDEEDTLQLSRMRHEASSDRVPLARLGNLAQMRRRKRGEMRSGSIQFISGHSHGLDMTLPSPEKSDRRSNQASKNTTLLARNVI